MSSYIVDVESIRHNCSVIKSLTENRPVYAVVKGNAYGLGLIEIASILASEGFTRFAVTEAEDAFSLSGIAEEILLLRPIADTDELLKLLTLPVTFCVGSREYANKLSQAAQYSRTIANAHIQIDTGLCRYGYSPSDLDGILKAFKMPWVNVAGMCTHYHSACQSVKRTEKQRREFDSVIHTVKDAGFDPGLIHTASSSVLFKYRDSLEGGVRIGSAFYGRLGLKLDSGLRRVGYVETRIDAVRPLRRGQTAGYGAYYRAKHDMQVAVLPVGYYHGFGVSGSRSSSSAVCLQKRLISFASGALKRRRPRVEIGANRVTALGSIGMSHTVVDVTGLDCHVGDIVRLDVNPLFVKGLPVVFSQIHS